MDPQDMTDEELKAKIEGQLEETATNEEAPVASPEEEPAQAEPAEKPEPEAEPETPAAEEPEEAPAPSRREQLRVQQLLKKYGPPPEAPQPEKPAPSQDPTAPDFRQLIDAEDPVYETLEKTTTDFGQNQYQRGTNDALKQMRTVEWRTLLHLDAPSMEAKYKVLDKTDKENFHPALSDALSRRYLQMVGYDPSNGTVERPEIRWKDFIESEFELAEEIASTKTAASTKNIAKQAAQTGLRPDGSGARGLDLNKHPEDMTDEELKAAVAASMPRDRRGRFTRQ